MIERRDGVVARGDRDRRRARPLDLGAAGRALHFVVVRAKTALFRLPLSPRLLFPFTETAALWSFAQWLRPRLETAAGFESRERMYSYLNRRILDDRPITYLEFGVFRGDSMRAWTTENTQPGSSFIGFDTFEGLPEPWNLGLLTVPSRTFSRDGELPAIADPRVRWVKGLFQQTLPGFLQEFRPGSRLVLHLDADLYTSTMFVLATCHAAGILVPGTILIFDDFSAFQHDFRALEDYASAFRRRYRLLAYSGEFYNHVGIEIEE